MDLRITGLRRAIMFLTFGLLLPVGAASAGSATWTGTGTLDWNVPTNWTPATIPNGPTDIATFGATFSRAISLSSFTEVDRIVFGSGATASFTITTPPAVAFSLTGVGITNNSGHQETFETRVSGAFAGLTQFSNSAAAGRLTLFNNYGGLSSAGFGGVTQFKNTSTADHASFVNIAGQASGAFGGYTEFDDSSTAGSASIVNVPAATNDVTAGFTWFKDTSTAGNGVITNSHGGVGKPSGFTKFNNNATAGNASFRNNGATATSETSAATNFYDTSNAGLGIFSNIGGYFNGPGGLTSFADSSSADIGTFFNYGGPQPGAPGGNTVFYNNSTATFGTFANYGGTRVQASGGETKFYDASTAGHGEFDNYGGTVSSADGGYTRFFGSSTADTGTFTNNGAAVGGAYGGTTSFSDSATAGGGIFINSAGMVNTGLGGYTVFNGSSTAGTGTFTNNGAVAAGALAGFTRFNNTSSAAQGTFTNNSGPAGGTGFVSGVTEFVSSSNAGTGTFTNNGGNSNAALGGFTYFFENSTADHGTFTNNGGTISGARGGITQFNDSSTAGNGIFYTAAGTVSGANAGMTQFNNSSSAGSSTITNQPSAFAGEPGGLTQFNNTSTAGTATILNQRAATSGDAFAGAGKTEFLGSATAGSSAITNEGGASVNGGSSMARGTTDFRGTSTAGAAVITNLAAETFFAGGGATSFYDSTNAGTATIVNAGTTISALAGFPGGQALFFGASSGGAAMITNQGASVTGGDRGSTTFAGTTAGSATIINEAGAGGGWGGYTQFYNQATGADAGSATIINQAPVDGAYGGVTYFLSSSAGTASIIAEGGSGAGDSRVIFAGSTAASSTLTALGATAIAGQGGRVEFYESTAANATLIATSGTVPGAPGGRFIFTQKADGGAAAATIDSGAAFDISGLTTSGMPIGSIEGGGTFFLGSKYLTVGGNGASTVMSGMIVDGGLSGGAGGSLMKTGAGTLNLSGANTYTGLTSVNAGTLAVNGSITGALTVNSGATLGGSGTVGGSVTVASGGILSPGNSPGTLTVASLSLSGGSIFNVELSGTTPGTGFDQIYATGQLSLGGTLNVLLIDNFAPVAGQAFDILDWGSRSGTFASINLPPLSGLTWNTSQLYTSGVISVGLPGDYNNNGIVDAADYVVWRKGLGAIYAQNDYEVWRANFDAMAGSGTVVNSPGSAVPEPSSILGLLAGSVVYVFFKRTSALHRGALMHLVAIAGMCSLSSPAAATVYVNTTSSSGQLDPGQTISAFGTTQFGKFNNSGGYGTAATSWFHDEFGMFARGSINSTGAAQGGSGFTYGSVYESLQVPPQQGNPLGATGNLRLTYHLEGAVNIDVGQTFDTQGNLISSGGADLAWSFFREPSIDGSSFQLLKLVQKRWRGNQVSEEVNEDVIVDVPFQFGLAFNYWYTFQLSATGQSSAPPSVGYAEADFMHTGRFTGGAVFDSAGNALVNPVINSDTGFDYVNVPELPLPGDFNADGTIDAADYVTWRNGLDTTYTQADYDQWRANFGAPPSTGSGANASASAAAAVPEPGAMMLFFIGLVLVVCGCKTRARAQRIQCTIECAQTLNQVSDSRISVSPYLAVSLTYSLVFLLTFAQLGQAQTSWTAGTADWKFSGNWSAGVPNSSTPAYINNGGTARVFVAGAAANYLGLGEDVGGQGSLEITGGELVTNFVRVGLNGDGAMAIHNGGKLTSRFGTVGSSGPATAEVSGSNSSWLITPGAANDAAFDVGQYGSGSLYIHDGGSVSYTYAPEPVVIGGLQEIIGGVSTSSGIGVVIVDGANSKFLNSADSFVGDYGIGRLYVENGAHATNYNGDLGVGSSGDGSAYVDGSDSLWTNNSVLAVGVSGTAMLSVSNSGSVTSTNGRIGREAGSNGIAFIDGPGSNWTASGDMSIGYFGAGALNILNGAKVSNQNSNIGDGGGSNGTVTVSGVGSWWQNLGVCAIGSSGTGRLEIHDGAIVSNTNGRIGRSAGSAGTVVVDGSLWSSTGVLTIGLAGTGAGTLTVTNDGDVSAVGGVTNGPLGTVTGDGRIEQNLANGGLVAPGNPLGTLHLKSDFTQTSTGTLRIELGSPTSFDKLAVVGNLTIFGGILDVSLAGGYVPRGGTYSFDILDWGARNGVFSTVQLPNDGTLTWDTSQLYTTGVISVTGTGSPDDFNGNGKVDAADYVVWRKGLGTTYTQDDYNAWRAHFGKTSGAGSGANSNSFGNASSNVPEPSSLALVMLCFVATGLIRRVGKGSESE